MPIVLVGTQGKGRANFMPVGFASRVNADPPMIAVGINSRHFTVRGMNESKTFSVNIPRAEMVEKVDYCGLVSGREVDKSRLFTVFYGQLKTAPMIEECPVCLECRLVDAVELPTNTLYIGEIVAVYSDDTFMTDGKTDFTKVNPLFLTMPDNRYWRIGPGAGMAWKIGRSLKPGM